MTVLSLLNYDFPIILKNTTDNKRVVGGLDFPPNESLWITENTYKLNQYYIDYSVGSDFLVVVELDNEQLENENDNIEDINNEENDVFDDNSSEQEVLGQDDDDNVTPSIVDRFVNKEVHWSAVRKYVSELDNMQELEKLLIDAQFHGLTDDSVIIKSINDRIGILNEKSN